MLTRHYKNIPFKIPLIIIWGDSFAAISIISFYSDPEMAKALNKTPTIRLFLSLGFQLGKLIIPPLTPIILWLYLYRDYAHQLVPRQISSSRPSVIAIEKKY